MNEDAVLNWTRKADNDLKIGKDELTMHEPVTDMVCFHMQQCVEKYLKAFLIFYGREYPRTHSIAMLVQKCAEIDSDFQDLEEWGVDKLTDHATVLRYGEQFRMPSLAEAQQLLKLTETVRNFVLEKLRSKGFGG